MGREQKPKVIKRRVNRKSAIFIDGVGLDRATKRINRKVSVSGLIKSLSGGYKTDVIRYYTIIPNEDDSRHRAYLDAVQEAGAEVIVKRLPPIGVNKQIDIYPEMSADIVAFSFGHENFSALGSLRSLDAEASNEEASRNRHNKPADTEQESDSWDPKDKIKKTITIVCPTRDISYSIAMATEQGIDTVTADFSECAGRDVLKNSAKWIDLSDSDKIWRE